MLPVSEIEERILFSPTMPDEVNRVLQQAVALSRNHFLEAERLFKRALELDRSCLQGYFALYKFYFHYKQFNDAEREIKAALAEAARQGGFPDNLRQLIEPPHKDQLYAGESGLFYLFSLKALAFVKLRRRQDGEAQTILALLQELDPEDRSGASVIRSLANAIKEDD
jgi:tetratricopeptide (TPR) repeat protein